ncbi:MAG: orotidine-5'-phosphate decarboxylase, partial [Eggerthellaceae bacterium]|nr:orotidine-5'-phosphate decarboxylase [Eggerthellaceae bacterium]
FYQEGPYFVTALQKRGFKVFLDLKFHDIPHQVKGAAQAAAEAGVDMLTMHAIGGSAMMKAAKEGLAQARWVDTEPISLAITVLTSMSAEDLSKTGVTRSVTDQVLSLATQAKEAGLSGVVASPQEAAMLREVLGPHAYIVTPGVRPAGSDLGDQSRVATPKQAFDNGASHIVIGRPITGQADPAAAFDAIVKEL